MLIALLVAAALSGAIIFGGLKFLLRGLSQPKDDNTADTIGKISECSEKLEELCQKNSDFASQAQLDSVTNQLKNVRTDLAAETDRLKEFSLKLGGAQSILKEKEAKQQSVKAASLEEQAKLDELLSNYTSVSEESMLLEQKLAASLNNLDSLLNMEGLEISKEQKDLLIELSSSLGSAAARLRDLITENAGVHERLTAIKQQHVQLEDEYTRLVEQQLGEA